MSKTLSALVSMSMLGLVGMANTAEPLSLTDEQMDSVTAGFANIQVGQSASATDQTGTADVTAGPTLVAGTQSNVQTGLVHNNLQNINASNVNQQ